ncbi:MAG TPA: hypothetical protein VFO25_10260 [Candidatus Eremiobacteraceae bacterium]|nr:hypothetical protein [Candidatus Eremiobacteraceae bacterium]
MIVSAFRGIPYRSSMPTVVNLLSNLPPTSTHRSWTVEDAGDLSPVDACVGEIQTRGLAFIEQHMTLESMRQSLIERLAGEYYGFRYTLAVVHAMLGRQDLGMILLSAVLEDIRAGKVPATEEFLRFVRWFESSPLDIYSMDQKELARFFRGHAPD